MKIWRFHLKIDHKKTQPSKKVILGSIFAFLLYIPFLLCFHQNLRINIQQAAGVFITEYLLEWVLEIWDFNRYWILFVLQRLYLKF